MTIPGRIGWAMCVVFGATALSACNPTTTGVDGFLPDLAQVERDMAVLCEPASGNLLQNAGFETLVMGADPNGSANNLALPPSTIPNWTGCCGPGQVTTEWKISTAKAHCGLRSVLAVSTQAMETVLLQEVLVPGSVGKPFACGAWIYVTSALTSPLLRLDVFDNSGNKNVIAASQSVSIQTEQWVFISTSGTVPTNGMLQMRLYTNGTITGYFDDVSFVVK